MALALDGSVHGNATAASLGVSLTTANANDIIVVIATINSGPVTSVVGGGLTWNFVIADGPTAASQIEFWYAVAASALSSVTITVTQTGSGFITVDAFGISGADTSTIFDANASTPDSSTTGLLSITTDTADTFIIGGYRISVANPTEGSGWTKISGADFQLTEYMIVSSTQSALAVTIGTGNGSQNGGVGHAIIIAAAGGATRRYSLSLSGVGNFLIASLAGLTQFWDKISG